MRLNSILDKIEYLDIINQQNVIIKSLNMDSRNITKGSLFFCIIGDNFDGHDYAVDAVNGGAKVLVVERELDLDVCQIVVKSSRITMSQISKVYYGSYCDKMKTVAVVGTNGKTTTSYIISSILKKAGIKNAIIGTNGTVVEGSVISTNLTTPDPIELHKTFKMLYALDVKVVVLEVSAHAIYFDKLYGVKFDIGIFTNVSPEHLDFFKTIENYSDVKKNYLTKKNCSALVVNSDDEVGQQIIREFDGDVFSYGLQTPAHTFAVNIKYSINKSNFVVNAKDKLMQIKTKMIGVYNIYNILAAINATLLLDVSVDDIIAGLEEVNRVPGRMEIYNLDRNNKVIIDFAHTSGGFVEVLSMIRELRSGKVITLFGCVEYADYEKRKDMGNVASKYSDHIILTSDNPNYEDIKSINSDIILGFKKGFNNYSEIDDRQTAIVYGFSMLDKNDTLVLLGKGIEGANKINGVDVICNDYESLGFAIESETNFFSNAKK